MNERHVKGSGVISGQTGTTTREGSLTTTSSIVSSSPARKGPEMETRESMHIRREREFAQTEQTKQSLPPLRERDRDSDRETARERERG